MPQPDNASGAVFMHVFLFS